MASVRSTILKTLSPDSGAYVPALYGWRRNGEALLYLLTGGKADDVCVRSTLSPRFERHVVASGLAQQRDQEFGLVQCIGEYERVV